MPVNPRDFFPDFEHLHRLYPALEAAARDLEKHWQGYREAGRRFQRLYLSIFPPGRKFPADTALQPLSDRLDEIRRMITEADFPNNHLLPLADNNDQIVSLCLFLSLSLIGTDKQ